GSWRWARQHGLAVRNANGRAIRLIGSTGDITEGKQLAEALAQAEARLQAAVEAASEGFVVWDEQDRLVICNSVYRKFFRGNEHLVVPASSLKRSCGRASSAACSPMLGRTLPPRSPASRRSATAALAGASNTSSTTNG